MADASNAIVSGPTDDSFSVYRAATNPTSTTQVLVFNPGFGQDQVAVQPVYQDWSPSTAPQPIDPYVVRLGAGLTPADVQLLVLDDSYVGQRLPRAMGQPDQADRQQLGLMP